MRNSFLTLCVVLAAIATSWAGQPSSFDAVMEHYEPIRLALLADTTDGVANHGKAIATELRRLQADFSPARAGTSAEVAPVVEELLPAMIAAADALGSAGSLEAARSALYDLSRPLVRWHQGVAENGRPKVAYCPMHKKSWLQPGSEIGNPYGGMPRCGEIVSE